LLRARVSSLSEGKEGNVMIFLVSVFRLRLKLVGRFLRGFTVSLNVL
jgi:hypothetical protein